MFKTTILGQNLCGKPCVHVLKEVENIQPYPNDPYLFVDEILYKGS